MVKCLKGNRTVLWFKGKKRSTLDIMTRKNVSDVYPLSHMIPGTQYVSNSSLVSIGIHE